MLDLERRARESLRAIQDILQVVTQLSPKVEDGFLRTFALQSRRRRKMISVSLCSSRTVVDNQRSVDSCPDSEFLLDWLRVPDMDPLERQHVSSELHSEVNANRRFDSDLE